MESFMLLEHISEIKQLHRKRRLTQH
ncbi:hypothetical protein RDI58_011870 [Solanum bulbocastanum]|uniref:Uncharacterized protein n=1 Tax=Solanum bulbocastanum TaxID=147425 RepID=A0AAN8YGP5_SOLBU